MRLSPELRIPVLLAVLAIALPLACPAQTRPVLRQSFDLQVLQPPTPVIVEGKVQLVYELHLTNFSSHPLKLKRVMVLNPEAATSALGDYQGAQLSGLLGWPGTAAADKQSVVPGSRAVLYFWLTPGNSSVPSTLRHRIEFDVPNSGDVEHAFVEGGAVTVRHEPALILHPPLQGGPWAAIYDPSMERGHRRVIYATHGRVRIPGRFAIDWIRVDKEGKSARGDESQIANWYGYGAAVLAVADSVVAAVRDGVTERSSIPDHSRAPVALEDASGNCIALDLGHGRYAFYEHLKPGSILVKPGDRVNAGQTIAALGYTGESSGPHLHFHVSDANSPLGAEGVPYVIAGFGLLGAFESIDAFAKGAAWLPAPAAMTRKRIRELPAANAVVEFGAN